MRTSKHLKKYGEARQLKVVNVVWYGDDHPDRDNLVKRFLEEVCGLAIYEIDDMAIRRLDHVPIEAIMRPLLLKDGIQINNSMLANRFKISPRKVNWLLFRR